MNRLLLLACLSIAFPSLAQTITTTADAFKAGQDFSNSTAGSAAATATINTTTGTANVPKYNTSPPETSVYAGGKALIGGAGSTKQANCKGFKAATAYDQQDCDAVNYMTKQPSEHPKFVIDKKTDPLMVNSKSTIASPGTIPGSGTSACHIEKTTVPGTFSTVTCVEAFTSEPLTCNRVLTVACAESADGCDQGGIVAGSWAGDMATTWTSDGAGNYILQFGTIEDNYWSGDGAVFDRTLTFDVKDLSLITVFSLTRAAFDDWIMVKVNDQLAYVGPYGGDRLNVYTPADPKDVNAGKIQYCETCFGEPELSVSWNNSLNIDLIHLLKEGSNSVFVRTIVAGNGEGAVQFTTRQKCPRVCTDSWDESQCAPLSTRAR